jgi:diguanylate cyclase (GGDEF)-like protein
VFLAVAGTAAAATSVLPLLAYALGPAAAVAVAAATRRRRPEDSWAWLTLAAALLCFGLGCFGLGLSALAATMLVLALVRVGSPAGRARRMLYVDAAAVFAGSFVVVWFFVLDARFDRGGSPSEQAALFVSPLLDIALLALVARIALTPAFRLPAHRLLGLGLVLASSCDLLARGYPQLAGGTGSAVVHGLMCALLGAAALHPTMSSLAAVPASDEPGFDARHLVLIGGALLSLPLAYLARTPVVGSADAWDGTDAIVFTTGLVAIPALVVYRLVSLIGYARELADGATRSSARLAAILDATPLPVRVLSPDGAVLLANEAAVAWDELGMFTGRDADRTSVRARALAGERLDGAELRLGIARGETRQGRIWTAPIGEDGELDAIVAVFADVTEQREREEQIRYLAEHDPLTGVLNRRGFEERLEASVRRAGAGTPTALALLDVDDLKHVNDSAGHPAGDALLAGLASELAAALRPGDVLARLSGDEFAVVIDGAAPADALAIAGRLLAAARRFRLVTRGASIGVTLSIGLYALDAGTNAEQALAHADAALYGAKERGRNRVVVWDGGRDRSAAA